MSDLPADTLTTTIEPLRGFLSVRAVGAHARGDSDSERQWLDALHLLDRAEAAVVSVLATHNEHTAANALRDAAEEWDGPERIRLETVGKWLRARADRLAAVSPTPPTQPCGKDCPGDCGYDPNNPDDPCAAPVPPTHTTTKEDQ
jgi:hypothetical protein